MKKYAKLFKYKDNNKKFSLLRNNNFKKNNSINEDEVGEFLE